MICFEEVVVVVVVVVELSESLFHPLHTRGVLIFRSPPRQLSWLSWFVLSVFVRFSVLWSSWVSR